MNLDILRLGRPLIMRSSSWVRPLSKNRPQAQEVEEHRVEQGCQSGILCSVSVVAYLMIAGNQTHTVLRQPVSEDPGIVPVL